MKNKKLKYCAPVLGAILLTGCGGGDSDSSSTGTQSSALEVTAGENITTYGKHTVTLIGEATDSDSEITSVEWSQSSDDSLQLTIVDSQTLTPTIEIPDIYTSEDVNLTLTVTNDDGEVVSDSVLVSLLPAEHSLSVALTGFGESLKVTNAEQEVVSGSLASDYPINSLTLINKTTNIQYQIDPTDTWQAGITLVEGDNDLEVSATSEDGTEISVETTVTYNELMDFTSSLSFDHPIIYTDQESVDVTAMIGSSNSQNPTMSLVDAEGNSISVLVDDGQLPDEIEGDGIFTASFTLTPSSEEELCFRVKATNSDESSYSSEQQCIWSLDPLVPEEVGTSVAIADNVELMVEQALEQGKTEAEALIFVLTDLQQNQNVGQAGVTGEGGLWWITESGILGLYHQSIEGSKRGSNSGVIGAAPSLKAPFVPQYYTANSFNSSTNYIALSSGDEVSLSTMSATDEANRIQSSKSIIVSPYINNPDDINNSFGTNDDYYSVWQTLKNSGSACKLEASNEAINNGSVAVSIDSFKDYSNFGYIHISTHGDNFYQGLFSLWEPTWGPNDFLRGALSQVALYTGIVLPVATNGEYDITGYEDDIQAKRIAIGGGGSIVLLPGFFKHYLTSMPNSLVVLSACRSMYNNSLANVLLSKGAGAVMGFDNYVLTSYAQNTTDHIISEMLNSDSTFGDAVNSAVNSYGANDGQLSPAALKVAGSLDLKLPDGSFNNLGFEDGKKGAWISEGDGRIITQLGVTKPTSGTYAGIISTGLGYTTSSGSFEQDGCLASTATSVSFQWNLFSEEFLEYCNSQYDDSFEFSVCEVDSDNCVAFNTSINTLCAGAELTASDISFDQGGVYDTGWKQQSLDIQSLSGKAVTIKASASDVGDSIYDTAILLDDITID